MTDYVLHNHLVEEYVRARPGDRVSVVRVRLVLRGKGRAETAARVLPRLSKRFLAAKLAEWAVVGVIAVLPKLLRRGAVFRRLPRLARRHGLDYHETDDVMSPATLAFLRERTPDVVVTLFHQIVRAELIAIPRLGVVNVHPGLLPDFRGIQPYLWELSEGAGRAGATLHRIDSEELDAGPVLGEASYATWAGMSVQLNYYLSVRCASALLPTCMGALDEGRLAPVRQDPATGARWGWPDSAALDRLAARGHPVVSLRDLTRILIGRHDSFRAENAVLHERPAPPAQA